MARFGIDFTTDISDRLATWEQQFVSETSWRAYERALAYVADTVAKRVSLGMRRAGMELLDRPTPWTLQGFAYRRALSKSRGVSDGFFSEFYVQDDQSIVLKYHLGAGNNVRYPGDVGLAQDRIWILAWANLAKVQGIKPNQYGNLQGGIMARFVRESQGDVSKRRSSPSGPTSSSAVAECEKPRSWGTNAACRRRLSCRPRARGPSARSSKAAACGPSPPSSRGSRGG